MIVGRDMRPHSEALKELVVNGARSVGATVYDCGLVTTPQLHFSVKNFNDQLQANNVSDGWSPALALNDYYSCLSSGFLSLSRPNSLFNLVIDGKT